jgi:hypothetical protein
MWGWGGGPPPPPKTTPGDPGGCFGFGGGLGGPPTPTYTPPCSSRVAFSVDTLIYHKFL